MGPVHVAGDPDLGGVHRSGHYALVGRFMADLMTGVDLSGRRVNRGIVFGTLVLDAGGMRWSRRLRWREPRRIGIAFDAVTQIEGGVGITIRSTDWRRLSFRVPAEKRFAAELTRLGFVLHSKPTKPYHWIATRDDREPDWNVGP